jgi:hypothetical protein
MTRHGREPNTSSIRQAHTVTDQIHKYMLQS